MAVPFKVYCEYSFFVQEIIGVFVLMESEELVVALRSNANVSNAIPISLKRDSFKQGGVQSVCGHSNISYSKCGSQEKDKRLFLEPKK